jgi:hypothetical protein
MNRMRSAMCISAAIAFAAVTMAAQEATDKTADKMDKKVTGCVQAGTSPGTYVLANAVPAVGDKAASDAASMTKAEMGTIMLTGTDVDLAPHVGHKVTISGTMTGKMADKPATATDTAAGAVGPSLKVKSLAMVSATCS